MPMVECHPQAAMTRTFVFSVRESALIIRLVPKHVWSYASFTLPEEAKGL